MEYPRGAVGRAEGLPALRIRQCDQSRMPRLETRLRAIHGPHFSVHRTLLGLWVAIGALVASAPGVQAEEGQQRYTSRATPHVTCVTRHAQRSRRLAVAPLHHGAPRCDGCFTPRQTV